MVFLAFAVACSVAIGMIFKHVGRKEVNRTALLTVNYAAAVILAMALLSVGGRSVESGLTLSGSLLGLGIGTGILLIGGFFALSWATEVAGMSLAIGVMRISVVIPFLASWFVWSEVPSVWQGIGMILAAGAFLLLAHSRSEPDPISVPGSSADAGGTTVVSASPATDWKTVGVLTLTFLLGGAVDVTMKAFEEGFGTGNSRVLFLLLAFGVAFAVGAVIVVRRGVKTGTWPTRQTVGWGVLLGIVNYGSLEFLLRAIEVLPGPFVFPANNIAIMSVAALLGVTVWHEKLSRPNKIGLSIAAVALLLLGL